MQASAVDKVANYNCTILDVAKVTIGDNCFMAPNVAIYTAGHPIYPDVRSAMWVYGKEVTFGDNVWIGGNTVICPGVHIGSNVIIGAGSVVTKDIPDWAVAAKNFAPMPNVRVGLVVRTTEKSVTRGWEYY